MYRGWKAYLWGASLIGAHLRLVVKLARRRPAWVKAYSSKTVLIPGTASLDEYRKGTHLTNTLSGPWSCRELRNMKQCPLSAYLATWNYQAEFFLAHFSTILFVTCRFQVVAGVYGVLHALHLAATKERKKWREKSMSAMLWPCTRCSHSSNNYYFERNHNFLFSLLFFGWIAICHVHCSFWSHNAFAHASSLEKIVSVFAEWSAHTHTHTLRWYESI